VLQFLDVVNNGYWHARGPEFSDQRAIVLLEWLRMPADLLFIFAGVVPLVIASLLTWRRAAKPAAANSSSLMAALSVVEWAA